MANSDGRLRRCDIRTADSEVSICLYTVSYYKLPSCKSYIYIYIYVCIYDSSSWYIIVNYIYIYIYIYVTIYIYLVRLSIWSSIHTYCDFKVRTLYPTSLSCWVAVYVWNEKLVRDLFILLSPNYFCDNTAFDVTLWMSHTTIDVCFLRTNFR